MKRKMCFAVIAALILFSASAYADTVVSTTGYGGWQSWTTAVLNQDGHPYWDGNSYDSTSSYNIGNYLTNTGGFSHPNDIGPGASYDYWGTSSGGSDKFGMAWVSGSNNATMKLEVAGYAGNNIFGYYDGDFHPLFQGAAIAGAFAIFTPTKDYVFYLQNQEGTFKTDRTGTNDSYQHFAIFEEAQGAGTYWIGMEDLKDKCESDRDYNDMIVKVSQVSTQVPEPATMLLLGLGLGLVGVVGMRKKFRR